MDEKNLLHSMLAKGDEIKEKYTTFDYNTLDSTQLKYINKLAFFAKHK